MELPFEKTVCRHWKQKLYTLLTQEESQEWKLPDTMPAIGRVISSWGQVILRGKDWRDRNIGISGGVMVWVLYAPEDGGALQHLETWIPFSVRTDMPGGGDEGVIRVETFLRSVDARVTSSRKLMLRAGIGLLVQVMAPDSLELLEPGTFPGDLELKVEKYPFLLTREAGERTFQVEESLRLPDRSPQVQELVYYCIRTEVTEQRVMGSKAAFRGTAHLHVLYIDPEGRLNGTDFRVPFAQYVELDEEYEDGAQMSNLICVTSLELEIGPEGSLELNCGMVSQYAACSTETLELLEDCYSPCREVSVEKEMIAIPAWLDIRQQSVELDTSFSGEQPVDLLFQPEAPTVSRRGDSATLGQGGVFRTLAMDQEGAYHAASQKEEQTMAMDAGCEVIGFYGGHTEPGCRKEAGSWRTDTRVMVDLASLCSQPMEVVTAIHLGDTEKPDPERPSVIIRAKGKEESLWELAKRCGSTVSAIRRMNQLEGEPEADRLLLIPVI